MKCPVTKKTGYENEDKAKVGMFHIWSHDPSADITDLHVYVCPFCKRWHIGHKSKYRPYNMYKKGKENDKAGLDS